MTTFADLVREGVLAVGDGYRAKNEELGTDGPIFLRSAYLQDNGWILDHPDRFGDISAKSFGTKIAREGDTVLTTKGNSLGRLGFVSAKVAGAVYSPHLSYWRSLDSTALLPRYLYYWAQSSLARNQVRARSKSTDMAPYLSLSDQLALQIELPPIGIQRVVADVLGALDDKIDLNRRMAETLEAMARALFRSWFVDFDPVRARAKGRPTGLPDHLAAFFPDRFGDDGLPMGWSRQNVFAFADVIYGAPFSSDRFNTQKQGLPLLRVRDLQTHEPTIYTDEQHPKAHVVRAGEIVVGMDGEFRCHIWRGSPSYLNQRVCSFVPKPKVSTTFLALSLDEPLSAFEAGAVGTTVIHLGKKEIDTINLLMPGRRVFEAFGKISDPLTLGRLLLSSEIRTLAALRDTLLPKLISGELRIFDAEKRISAA